MVKPSKKNHSHSWKVCLALDETILLAATRGEAGRKTSVFRSVHNRDMTGTDTGNRARETSSTQGICFQFVCSACKNCGSTFFDDLEVLLFSSAGNGWSKSWITRIGGNCHSQYQQLVWWLWTVGQWWPGKIFTTKVSLLTYYSQIRHR